MALGVTVDIKMHRPKLMDREKAIPAVCEATKWSLLCAHFPFDVYTNVRAYPRKTPSLNRLKLETFKDQNEIILFFPTMPAFIIVFIYNDKRL